MCAEHEKRLMDEDERGARQTDWEASERCNYSSQQGEGEITTHSVAHTTLPVCVCVYNMYQDCM